MRGWDLAARVDSPHYPAQVIGRFPHLLPGIACGDRERRAPGLREDGIQVSPDCAGAIVRVSVRSERNVDRYSLFLELASELER